MIFTRELYNKACTRAGNLTAKQLRVLNETQAKGWKKRIIGCNYSEYQIQQVMSLANGTRFKGKKEGVHSNKKRRLKRLEEANTIYISKEPKVTGYIEYNKQVKHPMWRRLRSKILERDEYTCKICGSSSDKNLHVHHIKYIGNYIWETPSKYLVTLCKDCHKYVHDKENNVINNSSVNKHQDLNNNNI